MRSPALISVLLILVIVFGTVFLWWPKYEKFSGLRQELKDKEAAVKQKQDYFKKLEEISNELKSYQDQVAKVESAFPEAPSEADLLAFIQKSASQSGLLLKEAGNSKVSAASQQQKIKDLNQSSFSISLTGKYDSLKSFLSALYKNSRLVEVSLFSLSQPKETEAPKAKGKIPVKTDSFVFDLTITAPYYEKSEKSQ